MLRSPLLTLIYIKATQTSWYCLLKTYLKICYNYVICKGKNSPQRIVLTDFEAVCFTDFVDWRYIHTGWYFRPSFWTVAPMDEGTLLVYCCPSTFSLTSPHCPFQNEMCSIYRQCACGCGVGGVELCCRPYSAGVLHSVSDQIQNLQNCFTTPNKNGQ